MIRPSGESPSGQDNVHQLPVRPESLADAIERRQRIVDGLVQDAGISGPAGPQIIAPEETPSITGRPVLRIVPVRPHN